MMTNNRNVGAGQANGTKALCKGVDLKPGEHPFPLRLSCGKTVAACFASQVKQILLCHENNKIVPREFSLGWGSQIEGWGRRD